MTKQIQLVPHSQPNTITFPEVLAQATDKFEKTQSDVASDNMLFYRSLMRLCKATHLHHRMTAMNVVNHIQAIFDAENISINLPEVLEEYEVKAMAIEAFVSRIENELKNPDVYNGKEINCRLADIKTPNNSTDDLPF